MILTLTLTQAQALTLNLRLSAEPRASCQAYARACLHKHASLPIALSQKAALGACVTHSLRHARLSAGWDKSSALGGRGPCMHHPLQSQSIECAGPTQGQHSHRDLVREPRNPGVELSACCAALHSPD